MALTPGSAVMPEATDGPVGSGIEHPNGHDGLIHLPDNTSDIRQPPHLVAVELSCVHSVGAPVTAAHREPGKDLSDSSLLLTGPVHVTIAESWQIMRNRWSSCFAEHKILGQVAAGDKNNPEAKYAM
jgi:hypothetical protein